MSALLETYKTKKEKKEKKIKMKRTFFFFFSWETKDKIAENLNELMNMQMNSGGTQLHITHERDISIHIVPSPKS